MAIVEIEVEADEILEQFTDDDLMDLVEARGLLGGSSGLGAQRQAMLHALWDNDEAKAIELLKTYLCDTLNRAGIWLTGVKGAIYPIPLAAPVHRIGNDMECDCITKFENRIKEMFKKERGVEPTEVCCKGVGFTLGGGNLNSILSIPFTVKADVTGYRSKGGKDMPVVANYCPFCGKPAREKAKE